MKRTFFLLLLLISIFGIIFFLSRESDKKTTIADAPRDFAVENVKEIYKIFIADRNGNSVTLAKKENYWQLNERWRANPNSVANLLQTIQKVKIKYIPPRTAVPNIIKDIATNNIKVEIYDKANQLMKAYYVGGVTNDELGTHMIMADAEEPFVTYMPGFEGALRVRYMVDEMDWRDKTIFQESINNIRAVSIEYPKQRNLSFHLSKEAGQYNVLPFYNTTPRMNHPVSRGLIEKYLTGFERQVAEGFENQNSKRDSIVQLLPFSIINLERTDGSKREVKLYPIIEKTKSGQVMLNDEGSPLIEKYFAEVDGVDFMLVQQLVFGKLLWSYGSFFESK